MKKKIWLIEIIIWLIIIIGCFYYLIYNTSIKSNSKNTYYIFVDNANGLVKGSPVRIMGINIGYIRDVKIFDNKIFVSFLVTKEGVTIPKHATAAIEFYGLGGSTSLELYPSTSSNSDEGEMILKGNSYRVQDFWDGQVAVADVMINIYGSFGRMIKRTDLLNHKDLFKQSDLARSFVEKTGQVNSAQSVIIYNLTEDIMKKSGKLPDDEEVNREAELND